MATFNKDDQNDIADFILDNLSRHAQFVLGTIDPDGNPWVVCLNLAFDNKINVIWKSKSDTEHSKHILKNPHVGICIFSVRETKDELGFYAKGVAHEVSEPLELKHCLDARSRAKGRMVSPASDFIGDAPFRIYSAELTEAWINDERHLKIKVDLDTLRKRMLQSPE